MTNQQIIMQETQRLAREGVLQYTGRVLRGILLSGQEVEIQEVEEIHTFAGWKARGFSVKKGEHARAAFPVWTFRARRSADNADDVDSDADGENGGENNGGGRCYLKKAFWFTRAQVQEITA